jgi:hypothetical protein
VCSEMWLLCPNFNNNAVFVCNHFGIVNTQAVKLVRCVPFVTSSDRFEELCVAASFVTPGVNYLFLVGVVLLNFIAI